MSANAYMVLDEDQAKAVFRIQGGWSFRREGVDYIWQVIGPITIVYNTEHDEWRLYVR